LEGTAPLEVTFTDRSKGYPRTWTWDFGDGHTASVWRQGGIAHTYWQPGVHDVRLTVENAGGESVMTRHNYVTVEARPSPPVQGNSEVWIYNCSSEHHSLSIWLRDATAATSWERQGTLPPQWDATFGYCPAEGAAPMKLPLQDGHVYEIKAVDPIWCNGEDDPNIGSCTKAEAWALGDSDGPIGTLTL
jgi:PKD repeat protein